MATRHLPARPNLEHLQHEAREFQRLARSGDPTALDELGEHHPRRLGDASHLKLADAQAVVARSYGFASWARLKHHLVLVHDLGRSPGDLDLGSLSPADRFLALACLTYGGDSDQRWRDARALLDSDPSIASTNIWTAAASGHVEAARQRVAASPASVSERGGPYGWEPLFYAAYSRVPLDPGRSTLAVAQFLLEHGADPNVGYLWDGTYTFTALTGAFGGGEDHINQPPHPESEALARALLEAGAEANDEQALYNRMFTPDDGHLRLLFEFGLGGGNGGPWRARLATAQPVDEMLAMQLQWAAEHGFGDRVRLLLAHGVDPNAICRHPAFRGNSAVELAQQRGHTDIVEQLVAAGASQRPLDPEDELVAACLRGDRDTAARLIAADPDIVERVQTWLGPMVTAAEMRRPDAIELMVGLGFDVNHRLRVTALHAAATNGDVSMVRRLLELGADPDIRDTSFDAPALGWARHHHHDDVVAILEPLTDTSTT